MFFELTSQERKTIFAILSLLILGLGLDFFMKKTNKAALFNYENIGEQLFEKVDINKAGAFEFLSIPGVGQGVAESIVDFRNSHGRFNKIEDLKNIRGIKDKKLEKLRRYITIEPDNP